MAIVQFRIHPGVGCARMGNSAKAYHLASEFPYFLQEEFPELRFKPKPRTHPRSFFPDNDHATATGTPGTYNIYDSTPAFQNAFKENTPHKEVIFPQGVRFRVFAYVYDNDVTRRRPMMVFEVTADMADITWKVDIANKKSQAGGVPDENKTAGTVDLVTTDTTLLCKRVRRDKDVPNLAYVFLERDDANKDKVTGRLHVIGNEGQIISKPPAKFLSGSLWSDDWYDSAGDGPVQAIINPKVDAIRIAAGVANIADLKFFSYNTDAPQPSDTANIHALPAWVVIGPPDYVPDMGHFVSLWDVALDRGHKSLETSSVINQPGKHKLIRWKSQFGTYRKLDYLIHIHPHLCLFDDVKFVSGEAMGEPEFPSSLHPPGTPLPLPHDRAHNKHAGPLPSPPNEPAAIKHGGILFDARTLKADLAASALLKDTGANKPIGKWLKKAIFTRLRKPGSLYDKKRKFIIWRPGDLASDRHEHTFPRKLGRRMDYDLPAGSGDKNLMYEFPDYEYHEGNLLRYHGLPHTGQYCGGAKSPPSGGPAGSGFSGDDVALLGFLDDMYWPATFSDMPMLRELAFTELQYLQFDAWQAPGTAAATVFNTMVTGAVKASFSTPGKDADQHFADFLAASPSYATALIDMAAMGAMLGGSFLPGIEVGREAGILGNWSLFYGATDDFPTIRFKPVGKPDEHTHGTLTKDLAIPWSEDFKDCDEKFWPTSRPGKTTTDPVTLARHHWLITADKPIPHLLAAGVAGATLIRNAEAARAAADADPSNVALETAAVAAELAAKPFEAVFVREYWKVLGFIRRDATNRFFEEEQTWH